MKAAGFTVALLIICAITYWASEDIIIWPIIKTQMGWIGFLVSGIGLILGIFGQDGNRSRATNVARRTDWQGIGITGLTIGLIILAVWVGFWLRYG